MGDTGPGVPYGPGKPAPPCGDRKSGPSLTGTLRMLSRLSGVLVMGLSAHPLVSIAGSAWPASTIRSGAAVIGAVHIGLTSADRRPALTRQSFDAPSAQSPTKHRRRLIVRTPTPPQRELVSPNASPCDPTRSVVTPWAWIHRSRTVAEARQVADLSSGRIEIIVVAVGDPWRYLLTPEARADALHPVHRALRPGERSSSMVRTSRVDPGTTTAIPSPRRRRRPCPQDPRHDIDRLGGT